jgi:hypothetical protein
LEEIDEQGKEIVLKEVIVLKEEIVVQVGTSYSSNHNNCGFHPLLPQKRSPHSMWPERLLFGGN